MEKDVQLEGVTGVRYMYHDPCRSPMKRYDALKVVNSLMNEAYNGHRSERPLLRGLRPAGADAAGCIRTSAVPQGGGDARWNREVPLPGASPVQSRC